MVHKGYLQAWRSIQPAVELLIEDACTHSGAHADWKVYFVGHSLGGGMATLATASAAAQGFVIFSVLSTILWILGQLTHREFCSFSSDRRASCLCVGGGQR